MSKLPEQQQNSNEGHPVVAGAYKVSSIIVESQPVCWNIAFIIITLVIIICLNSSNENKNESNNVTLSLTTSYFLNNDSSNNCKNDIDVTSPAATFQRLPPENSDTSLQV